MVDVAEAVGVSMGVGLMAVMLALERDVDFSEALLVLQRPFLRSVEATAVQGVEATPELEGFLRDLGKEKLLAPLTSWGARTLQDLTYLGEDDLEELGVTFDDTVFRNAIARLK